MLYRSHLTIFSIDNQHEKGSKKNAMGWSTTAYFPKYKEKYIIIEIDNVPSGEYVIVFTSNDYSNLNTNLKYQLFGIN